MNKLTQTIFNEYVAECGEEHFIPTGEFNGTDDFIEGIVANIETWVESEVLGAYMEAHGDQPSAHREFLHAALAEVDWTEIARQIGRRRMASEVFTMKANGNGIVIHALEVKAGDTIRSFDVVSPVDRTRGSYIGEVVEVKEHPEYRMSYVYYLAATRLTGETVVETYDPPRELCCPVNGTLMYGESTDGVEILKRAE